MPNLEVSNVKASVEPFITRAADIIFQQIPDDGSGRLLNPCVGRQAINCAVEELILGGLTPGQAELLTGFAVSGVMRAKHRIHNLQAVEDFYA
jgi:hypothetical protein